MGGGHILGVEGDGVALVVEVEVELIAEVWAGDAPDLSSREGVVGGDAVGIELDDEAEDGAAAAGVVV